MNAIQAPAIPFSHWQASHQLQAVPFAQAEELTPPDRRLVLVAPHPDDEVLIGSGLLAAFAGREDQLLLVSVTDGEGSHPGSRRWTADALRKRRPRESQRALSRLGLDVQRISWLRLGLADAAVARDEQWLVTRLIQVVQPGDQVLTTWREDGHCDHEAVGRACALAARSRDAKLIEAPVWAWHWASPDDPRLPWERARKVALAPPVLQRKRQAIAAHASQLRPDDERPPVLGSDTLQRLLQPFELVFT